MLTIKILSNNNNNWQRNNILLSEDLTAPQKCEWLPTHRRRLQCTRLIWIKAEKPPPQKHHKMSLGPCRTAPAGLGEGSGVVLMMANGFSASTFPKDSTGAVGTCPCLELCGICAATPGLFGKQLRGLFAHPAPRELRCPPGCKAGHRCHPCRHSPSQKQLP